MSRKKIEYRSGVKVDFDQFDEGIYVEGMGFMRLDQVDELIEDLTLARRDWDAEVERVKKYV